MSKNKPSASFTNNPSSVSFQTEPYLVFAQIQLGHVIFKYTFPAEYFEAPRDKLAKVFVAEPPSPLLGLDFIPVT